MRIKEWDLLRVIACLSILLLHSTTFYNLESGLSENSVVVHYIRILLCYATPTFILLSIIILAAKYKDGIPQSFWSKRLQFILLPYIFWAFIDALVIEYNYQNGLIWQTFYNNIVLGEFVGWFVLVILQLYLLFWLMIKFQWPSFVVLPLCALLYFLQHRIFDLPYPFFQENMKYEKLYGTAWFVYFVIAFIIGANYEKIQPLLKKYRIFTVIFTALSALYIWYGYKFGMVEIHSRRMDLIPFVVGITSMILAYGQLIPSFKIIRIISKYAFMIYLIHWNILSLTAKYFVSFFNNGYLAILAMMISTVIVAITISKCISYLPFGKWIVGKIR
ncbi:acyltransferase family protein [Ureibacillus sp. FSL K6-2830]|uniref:acyltransferase family protein n=1 Tax=Ureibacillus sp. FSL K6-2830 TaxID=2954610 RepID=UPI0030FC52AD